MTENYVLDKRELVLHLIGQEIAGQMLVCSSERESPSSVNPDRMDDKIKSSNKMVKDLRRIRQELETLFYGEIE